MEICGEPFTKGNGSAAFRGARTALSAGQVQEKGIKRLGVLVVEPSEVGSAHVCLYDAPGGEICLAGKQNYSARVTVRLFDGNVVRPGIFPDAISGGLRLSVFRCRQDEVGFRQARQGIQQHIGNEQKHGE